VSPRFELRREDKERILGALREQEEAAAKEEAERVASQVGELEARLAESEDLRLHRINYARSHDPDAPFFPDVEVYVSKRPPHTQPMPERSRSWSETAFEAAWGLFTESMREQQTSQQPAGTPHQQFATPTMQFGVPHPMSPYTPQGFSTPQQQPPVYPIPVVGVRPSPWANTHAEPAPHARPDQAHQSGTHGVRDMHKNLDDVDLRFDMMDTNSDGVITIDEFEAFLATHNGVDTAVIRSLNTPGTDPTQWKGEFSMSKQDRNIASP